MIVCVCKAVSDRQIRAAVNAGASHLRDLTRDFGLGTCCGKCLPEAKSTLAASLARRDNRPTGYFTGTPTCFAEAKPEFAV